MVRDAKNNNDAVDDSRKNISSCLNMLTTVLCKHPELIKRFYNLNAAGPNSYKTAKS